MPEPWIVVVCRGALVCLPPVGVYLSAVARRHRRGAPVVVSGPADFLALVLGLSGFLVAAGVLFLFAVQSDVRLVGRGNFAQIQDAWGRQRLAWGATALAYTAAVAGAVAVGLRGRAGTFSVTGADPAGVDRAVTDALAAAGVPAERFGSTWAAAGPVAAVDHAPSLGHATVRVLAADRQLRDEVARQLAGRLPRAAPARPAAGGVFAAAAGVCFGGAAAGLGLLVAYEVLRRV